MMMAVQRTMRMGVAYLCGESVPEAEDVAAVVDAEARRRWSGERRG